MYPLIKRLMENDPKNYIIFDNDSVYAAATDSLYFISINKEAFFFNGIQITKDRELILNLDEIITRINFDKIEEFEIYE